MQSRWFPLLLAVMALLLLSSARRCACVPQVDPVVPPGAPLSLAVVLPMDVYPCYALAALHAARDINAGTVLSQLGPQRRLLPNNSVQLYFSNSRQSSSVALAAILGQMESHGVVGVIGEVTSGVTTPLATLLSAFQTPHVAPQATVGDLSNKALYPYFARAVGGDDQQALALHSLMRYFGWTQAQIVYATDTYGTAFAADLQAVSNAAPARNETGVIFTSVNAFQTGDVGSISAALNAIVADGAPIVVLLASHSADARALAQLVVSRGLLGRFQFLACDGWFHPAVIKNSPPHLKANFTAFLEGVVGTVPLIPRGEATAQLNRNIRADTAGPIPFPYNALECVESDTTTSYYYDSVLMMAVSAARALARGGGVPGAGAGVATPAGGGGGAGVGRNITGSGMMREMLGGLQLEGLTGYLEINANGDRFASYSITNYQKSDGETLGNAGTFVHHGSSGAARGSQAPVIRGTGGGLGGGAAAAAWGSWHIDMHRAPVFVSGSTAPPSSARPRRVSRVISTQAAGGLIAGSVLSAFLVSLLPLGVVLHYRRHVAFKSSNVALTCMLLVGALVGCVYPSIAALHLSVGAVPGPDPSASLAGLSDDDATRPEALERYGSTASCLLAPLLVSMSFSLIFGSLLTKLSFIRLLFANTALKLYRLTLVATFAPTLCFLLLDAAIFLAWSAVDTPRLERRPLVSSSSSGGGASGDRGVDYFACVQSRSLLWQLLLLLPKFLMLALTALVAFRVREVPHAFNESRFIGIILYNLLFISALAILLVNTLDDPLVDLLVESFSVWYCLAATVVLLILPKLLIILGSRRRRNNVTPMQQQNKQSHMLQQQRGQQHAHTTSPRVRMSPAPLGSLGQGRGGRGRSRDMATSSLRAMRPSHFHSLIAADLLQTGPSFDVQLESPALSEYVPRSGLGAEGQGQGHTQGMSVASSMLPPFGSGAMEEPDAWAAGAGGGSGPSPLNAPVQPVGPSVGVSGGIPVRSQQQHQQQEQAHESIHCDGSPAIVYIQPIHMRTPGVPSSLQLTALSPSAPLPCPVASLSLSATLLTKLPPLRSSPPSTPHGRQTEASHSDGTPVAPAAASASAPPSPADPADPAMPRLAPTPSPESFPSAVVILHTDESPPEPRPDP